MHLFSHLPFGTFGVAFAIALAALLSEDAATIAAASLAAAMVVDVRVSFLSVFAGLWLGDLGVYGATRYFKSYVEKSPWFSRAAASLTRPSSGSNLSLPLAVSRFIPGTRLPAYVAAGLSRMSFPRYALLTAATATLWTVAVFEIIFRFPQSAMSLQQRLTHLAIAGLLLFAALFVIKKWGSAAWKRLSFAFARLQKWEFWPAWLFYAPVPLFCAWFSIRYRGISLPAISNLNQKNGGLVGESKIGILSELMESSPEWTAAAHAIPAGSLDDRIARISSLVRDLQWNFPLVLKPDTGQRGIGFKKVFSFAEIETYLLQVTEPLILQEYIPGPEEAGIFYYRFPGSSEGNIFGITRKRFPYLTGDGSRSLSELIDSDERARFLRDVYLQRLGPAALRIPAAGERVRLVEAGNHCQGCIFEDGAFLNSEPLRARMDEISGKLPGFFIGRFDVRYTSDAELSAGRGFRIIELNGAASEATNLYDARNSLWSAYKTLYRQWRLMYAIGAENRKRGASSISAFAVLRDWRDFSSRATHLPIAD